MKYKSLVNPSFLVITLELQDALLEGWRIDMDNLPVNNFTYSEIHLVKDDEEKPKDVIAQEPDVVRKAAGRPPKAKQ